MRSSDLASSPSDTATALDYTTSTGINSMIYIYSLYSYCCPGLDHHVTQSEHVIHTGCKLPFTHSHSPRSYRGFSPMMQIYCLYSKHGARFDHLVAQPEQFGDTLAIIWLDAWTKQVSDVKPRVCFMRSLCRLLGPNSVSTRAPSLMQPSP